MYKKIILVALLVAISSIAPITAQAQSKIVETSFEVSGICEMCKTRIEKAVDIKGVKYAQYDLDTHTLNLAFNSDKILEEDIHRILNEAGHDTEQSICSDEQYDRIHKCCKYREHEQH